VTGKYGHFVTWGSVMLHLHHLQCNGRNLPGCDLITVTVKKDNRLPVSPPDATSDTAERRRIGRIVRDDRDSATVEWVDAPADYSRVPLSIEGSLPRGTKRAVTGYNPYETISPRKSQADADKRPVNRDLRKLSEWIKQMRELEERKKRGDD
jgi:hypothetical protein